MDGTAAAIYRVSTEEESDKNLSLPAQLEACRRFADERGWGVEHGGDRVIKAVLKEPFRLLEGRKGPVPKAFQRESAVAEEVVGGEA
jgi:hypothetical protein